MTGLVSGAGDRALFLGCRGSSSLDIGGGTC